MHADDENITRVLAYMSGNEQWVAEAYAESVAAIRTRLEHVDALFARPPRRNWLDDIPDTHLLGALATVNTETLLKYLRGPCGAPLITRLTRAQPTTAQDAIHKHNVISRLATVARYRILRRIVDATRISAATHTLIQSAPDVHDRDSAPPQPIGAP